MNRFLRRLMLALAAAGMVLGTAGCRSMDDDASARPWNSPKGWENGIPSSMTEGR